MNFYQDIIIVSFYLMVQKVLISRAATTASLTLDAASRDASIERGALPGSQTNIYIPSDEGWSIPEGNSMKLSVQVINGTYTLNYMESIHVFHIYGTARWVFKLLRVVMRMLLCVIVQALLYIIVL